MKLTLLEKCLRISDNGELHNLELLHIDESGPSHDTLAWRVSVENDRTNERLKMLFRHTVVVSCWVSYFAGHEKDQPYFAQ